MGLPVSEMHEPLFPKLFMHDQIHIRISHQIYYVLEIQVRIM